MPAPRVTKQVEKWQHDRMSMWPSCCRPRGITYGESSGLMSYDMVIGRHCVDPGKILEAADAHLWGTRHEHMKKLPIDPLEYERHVMQVAEAFDCKREASLACRYVETHSRELTPVNDYHGDMTIGNVLEDEDGRVVFIDPGRAWGLPCVQLDLAKLCQSLDGFCAIYRNVPQPSGLFVHAASALVDAISLTHYVRLLAHVKKEAARAFARRRIVEIHKELMQCE